MKKWKHISVVAVFGACMLALSLLTHQSCSCSESASLSPEDAWDRAGTTSPGTNRSANTNNSNTSGSSNSNSSNSNSNSSNSNANTNNSNTSNNSNSNSTPPTQSRLTAGSVDDHLNFEFFQKFLKRTYTSYPELPVFEPKQASPRFTQPGQTASHLDLVFVVDTTGSMSDELFYLTQELSYITQQIKNQFSTLAIRFALVVYRDRGDAYTSKVFDFKTSLSDFQKDLKQQEANGGGDYPEAAHEGLAKATQLHWNDKAVRMIFWIADAPPHDQHMQHTLATFSTFQQRNIRLYPIAASGVQEKAEYIMRVGAFLTGSQYLFLTDDSGIGNSHAEPNILCYHVEKLNDLMARMIRSEVAGTRIQPTADQIIRTVGKPQNGKCMPQ